MEIVRKFNFENFLMTIKSAGFISPKMIGSKNALNFAYALYLRLRADQSMPEGERKRIVRRWFVFSLLTRRSTGSFETAWELDIRRIAQQGAASYLKQLEEAELSDGFWNVALPNALETTSTVSPYFQTSSRPRSRQRHEDSSPGTSRLRTCRSTPVTSTTSSRRTT